MMIIDYLSSIVYFSRQSLSSQSQSVLHRFFGDLFNSIASPWESQEISMSIGQNVKTTVRQSDIHWFKGIVGEEPDCLVQII